MSLLTDALPETVQIEGKIYPIETDFRRWIEFSQLVFTNGADAVVFTKMLALIFKAKCPPIKIETLTVMLGFFNPFTVDTATQGNGKKERGKIYDFDYDAKLIYASFLQQYGINLTRVSLHWWEFKALFDGLSEDTPFGKVLKFRCADISEIKDKNMQKYYRKMKNIYALPDNRTEKQKELDLANDLGSLM